MYSVSREFTFDDYNMTDFKALFSESNPIIDVRTPAEFGQGHLPGAFNIPLFSNEERHEVGLCYKKQGKDEAVKLGLKFVGPKLESIVTQVEELAPSKALNVYCWRGGMRSGSVAWLLRTAGFKVHQIVGGYKAWRNSVLEQMTDQRKWLMLGGYTGSGKTEILNELASKNENVIDLEGLAKHRGSAFGKLSESQPTTEHFENLLGLELLKMNNDEWIWVENESHNIGSVYLHKAFRNNVLTAEFLVINRSFEIRLEYLVELYGQYNTDILKEGFTRIAKRLDGQKLKDAMAALDVGDLHSAARTALAYYDKTYSHSMSKNPYETVATLEHENDTEATANSLIEWKKKTLLN
jgi:tRNA 2-selenouridine synthase